jgi:protein tyrosine/serine phosphatase
MDSDRIIPLEGVHNFRDYGGYPVAGGGRLKRGTLFRSGQHVDASDTDLARIAALELRHVIDFRGASERDAYPCRRGDGFSAEVIAFEGETANLAPHVEAADGVLTLDGAHRAMERIYRNLPNRAPVLWVMKRYFAALAAGEGASLVHCLAGKDRTGMAVALFHHALGVHPDDAMHDFLLTNTAGNIEARITAGAGTIRAKYGAIDDDTIRVLMGVDERYLHAMREAVEEAHGSLDGFLADVLGVDDATHGRLRERLVDGG